jgi:hypothetical protein
VTECIKFVPELRREEGRGGNRKTIKEEEEEEVKKDERLDLNVNESELKEEHDNVKVQ